MKTLIAITLTLLALAVVVLPARADEPVDPPPGAVPPVACVQNGTCPNEAGEQCQNPAECPVISYPADSCMALGTCTTVVPVQCTNPRDPSCPANITAAEEQSSRVKTTAVSTQAVEANVKLPALISLHPIVRVI